SIVRAGAVGDESLEVPRRPAQPRGAGTFTEQCTGEVSPSLVEFTEKRVRVDGDSVEANARQRPTVRRRPADHVDAGGGHVDEKHREAVTPAARGIGAGDGAAPVGFVCTGDEHLLA